MRLLLLLVSVYFGCANCSRILVLYPFGTLSHKISIYPAIEALGARGHNVTVVSAFAPKEKLQNVREIVLPAKMSENEGAAFFNAMKVPKAIAQMITFTMLGRLTENVFNILMSNPDFLDVLDRKDADIVLVDSIFNDFCMPIIEQLDVPFIFVSSSIPLPWHLRALNVPVNLATSPNGMSGYNNEMTFIERVDNFLLHSTVLLARQFYLIPRIESYTRKHFPDHSPIPEQESKASLFMMSTDSTFSWPSPLPPNVINLGALHCRPPKPLPQEFKTIADESSEHGFIVFTLGSFITGSSIPPKFVGAFVHAFSRIPQQVFWKWESDSLDVSSNVHLVKWLPQQDLLGHPNARLFLSHGGLLGIQEAVYHAVPLLGLPIANDQYGNIGKLVKEGMSIMINWEQLSESVLVDAITSIINSSSFKNNATRLSAIMRDTIVPGEQKAVYWTEYVLRHNGAAHLRTSGRQLMWYQYYLLDVVIFLVLSVVLVSVTAGFITCKFYRYYFRRQNMLSEKRRKND